jgi:hypothetical protein
MAMTWMVLLRWNFRGENKTGLIIHAKDQREAEDRVNAILPPTFFRATDYEITIAPTHKILGTSPPSDKNLAAIPGDAVAVQPSVSLSSWISQGSSAPSGAVDTEDVSAVQPLSS